MRYQISGMHIDIGQALQTHVKNELGDAVIKYAERPTDANVVFSKSGHEYVCETTVHLSTGLTARPKRLIQKYIPHLIVAARKWKNNCAATNAD